jgi:hypothetical protein
VKEEQDNDRDIRNTVLNIIAVLHLWNGEIVAVVAHHANPSNSNHTATDAQKNLVIAHHANPLNHTTANA